MKVSVGVRTDVGRVRENNEDSYLVLDSLFGVADGMGGHLAGDVASQMAVASIRDQANGPSPERLPDLIRDANRAIFELSQEEPSLHGMGTTCTIVLIEGSTGHFAHVGDSRAYLLRGGQLSQVTEDHSLVQRMVKEGRLRPEDAAHHPQRNIVTRVLGVDADVQVDIIPVELQAGDRVLLASDGLSSMIPDQQIQGLLGAGDDPQAIADALVDAANEAGGEDNTTVVVLHVAADEGGETRAPPAAATTAPPPPAPEGGTEAKPGGAPAGARRPRRLLKRLALGLLVLLVIGAGGVAAARWALGNAYFVGVNQEGFVTIYKGIPESVAGFDFRDVQEATGLSADELPAYKKSDLEEGIKVESLEEAQTTVASLEQLSEEFVRPNGRKRAKD